MANLEDCPVNGSWLGRLQLEVFISSTRTRWPCWDYWHRWSNQINAVISFLCVPSLPVNRNIHWNGRDCKSKDILILSPPIVSRQCPHMHRSCIPAAAQQRFVRFYTLSWKWAYSIFIVPFFEGEGKRQSVKSVAIDRDAYSKWSCRAIHVFPYTQISALLSTVCLSWRLPEGIWWNRRTSWETEANPAACDAALDKDIQNWWRTHHQIARIVSTSNICSWTAKQTKISWTDMVRRQGGYGNHFILRDNQMTAITNLVPAKTFAG